uniref:Uncharacterized protein n=2 Tax=Arundinoideae TaxID=156631 RepID=A0A0A8XUJ6_ARUDO
MEMGSVKKDGDSAGDSRAS